MNNYFYGWYFRFQGRNGSIAVIPAVHLSEEKRSCSIQVITQKESLYKEFPVQQFRINRKRGIMQIGKNLFSRNGIRLNFETVASEEICERKKELSRENADKNRVLVSGNLRFGKFTKPRYDIMGPFSCIAGMECRHAVYSMRHTVNGQVSLNHEAIYFRNGMGYMEGDSGASFPDRYIWTQHFLPEGSFMLAAASIPLAGMHFTGTVGILCCRNREYRFATYLGASVKKMGERELLIRQGRYRLQVHFRDKRGRILKAPKKGKMTRKVWENISCGAEYTLMYGKRILLHAVTDRAAAEYETKEDI